MTDIEGVDDNDCRWRDVLITGLVGLNNHVSCAGNPTARPTLCMLCVTRLGKISWMGAPLECGCAEIYGQIDRPPNLCSRYRSNTDRLPPPRGPNLVYGIGVLAVTVVMSLAAPPPPPRRSTLSQACC